MWNLLVFDLPIRLYLHALITSTTGDKVKTDTNDVEFCGW